MRRLKGFTLIELLVVVAIIGILSTVIVVNLSNSQNRAKDAKIESEVAQIANAAEVLKANNGAVLPTALKVTSATVMDATFIGNFKDGATQIIPTTMKHPVSGEDYQWLGSADGKTYAAYGVLASDDTTNYVCYSGKVCQKTTAAITAQ